MSHAPDDTPRDPRPTRPFAPPAAATPSADPQTMIVAEIGQNHNGSEDFARSLIDMVAMPVVDHFSGAVLRGVDAVKLTKRDLDDELTADLAASRYDSPHAFGPTYLEHRAALELSEESHVELGRHAAARGLLFIETLCSPRCVTLCGKVHIDYLKVASRDLTNVPLLRELASTRIPIILSTGMSQGDELDRALDVIAGHHTDVAILHCVSAYPAHYDALNLPRIQDLRRRYPGHRIGYSDHSIGIMAPVAAVCLGAEIIEKHVTLSRRLRGSDHEGSLEPEGLWRMTRDIRNCEQALRCSDAPPLAASRVADNRRKLGRSLSFARDLPAGHRLAVDDFTMLSPGDGLPWDAVETLLGRRLVRPVQARTHVRPEQVEAAPPAGVR